MDPSDFYDLGDICVSGVFGYISVFGLFALNIHLT